MSFKSDSSFKIVKSFIEPNQLTIRIVNW